MNRILLLACGVLSSLIYFAIWILGALWWEGYSSISQSISELSAIDAPSRPLVVPLLVAYSVSVIAFGVGVWGSAPRTRTLRIVAGLLIGFGIVCLTGPLTPMHQRGVAATLTDTLHIVSAIVDVAFILLIIGFGAIVFGTWFRLYSIVTSAMVLGFGAWAGLDGPRIAADLPTPWVGVLERICIGAYLLWFAVLAILLMRANAADDRKQHGAQGR